MTTEVFLPEVTGWDVEEAKQALRAAARERRAKRSAHERAVLAQQWSDTVMDFIGDGQVVACYVSIKDEPPTRELCERIAASGRQLLLPKLGPSLAREWAWYKGDADLEVLAPGRPPEPSGLPADSSVLADIDVLVMPAALIDKVGRRLGQGGGWYDRVLKKVSPTTKIGAMVFPDEYVSVELPQDDMDRRVPYVIFPDRWFAVGEE